NRRPPHRPHEATRDHGRQARRGDADRIRPAAPARTERRQTADAADHPARGLGPCSPRGVELPPRPRLAPPPQARTPPHPATLPAHDTRHGLPPRRPHPQLTTQAAAALHASPSSSTRYRGPASRRIPSRHRPLVDASTEAAPPDVSHGRRRVTLVERSFR